MKTHVHKKPPTGTFPAALLIITTACRTQGRALLDTLPRCVQRAALASEDRQLPLHFPEILSQISHSNKLQAFLPRTLIRQRHSSSQNHCDFPLKCGFCIQYLTRAGSDVLRIGCRRNHKAALRSDLQGFRSCPAPAPTPLHHPLRAGSSRLHPRSK